MSFEEPSAEIRGLYTDMYVGGSEQLWRDVGAADKSANIIRAWNGGKGLPTIVGRLPAVAEIGCGDGAIAQALQARSFFGTYQGFDLSPSGVGEARSRGVADASFHVVGGGSIPLDDSAADLVVMSHVIEHLEHPRQLLYEARRIAPVLIIEVPLELNVRAPLNYQVDALGHINKYNSISIRHLVQSCGFDVLHQFTTNPSRAVQTFFDSSLKSKAKWALKEAALRAWPTAARSRFTYHETLIARHG